MSMELMVKAMKCKVGNPLRKLVLIKLADNANDQGECWPSYEHIAEQCEISRRSAINHIDALISAGLLRKEIRKGGPKGNSSNLFYINFNGAGDSLPPSAGDSLGVVQEIHPTSAGDSLPPSAGAAPRTSHSLEPVNEPLEDLVSSELKTALASEPVLFQMPVKGKNKFHPVTQSDIREWSELYPAVDIHQQLRNMIGWCLGNPTRQKTASGVSRFIHSWLGREQNRGGGYSQAVPAGGAPDFHSGDTTWANGLDLGGSNETSY